MVEKIRFPLIDRYQRLIDLTLDLASTFDLDELLKRIVHAAADLSRAQAASILLYDEASQQLHFEAATNMEGPRMRGLVVPVESSLAGWIITHRQPVIVSDTQKDPRHFDQVSKVVNLQTTSLLGVPLIAKDKIVGVLEAINKLEGDFNLEDQDLLYALAAQAAIAIQNTRLFQQSDAISELIHELRTPLASLNTAAHLMLKPEVSDDQRSRMVEIIQDETFRLTEMATSYLDLARLESGRAQFCYEEMDIREVLLESEAVMHGRAQEKGLKILLALPDSLPLIKADRSKIKQVIINLISNAIKYNHPKGSLTLAARMEGRMLIFSVSDTGPGIQPEAIPMLFQKFYRVPGSEMLASGTGLGLSICKHIVDAHRGRIEVQSEVSVGTTFSVYLPLDAERKSD